MFAIWLRTSATFVYHMVMDTFKLTIWDIMGGNHPVKNEKNSFG